MSKSFEDHQIVQFLLAMYRAGWPIDGIAFVDGQQQKAKVVLPPGCSVIVGYVNEECVVEVYMDASCHRHDMPSGLGQPGLRYWEVELLLRGSNLWA